MKIWNKTFLALVVFAPAAFFLTAAELAAPDGPNARPGTHGSARRQGIITAWSQPGPLWAWR